MAKTKEQCQKAKEKLSAWLQQRGLKLSNEKTSIKHLKEEVDFLGFNIRQYKSRNKKTGNVTSIKPSKESQKRFKRETKILWRKALGTPLPVVIRKLNSKITGWGNYYHHAVSSNVFSSLDSWMWTRQARYSVRMHPQKQWWWRKEHYWGSIPGSKDQWVFMDKVKKCHLRKLKWIPIVRHSMVKGRNSPDDPTLTNYWKERQKKNSQYPKNSMRGKLWKKQKGLCPICKDHINNGERIHLHHIIPKSQGGGNSLNNLCIVHEICHRQVHSRHGHKIAIRTA